MSQLSREQLVEFITSEVLRTLSGGEPPPPENKIGCPTALVIGDPERLPTAVKGRYNLCSVDCAAADYETIFITALTMTELSDIALGRDGGPVQKAVIDGLLGGKELFLYDSALSHRAFAGRGSRAFYQLLEGYVRTLQSFGIKLVQGTTVIDKYLKFSALGADLPTGVITEALARSMVEKSEGDIPVRKGCVITPSAKDVFLHAGRQLQFI